MNSKQSTVISLSGLKNDRRRATDDRPGAFFSPVNGQRSPVRLHQHDFIQEWRGGGNQFPYPVYEPVVEKFIVVAGQNHWMDFNYRPQQAGEMLYDDAVVATADLPAIKTLLTFVVRGERFTDGHWGNLLKNGRIVALLRRLETIRTQ